MIRVGQLVMLLVIYLLNNRLVCLQIQLDKRVDNQGCVLHVDQKLLVSFLEVHDDLNFGVQSIRRLYELSDSVANLLKVLDVLQMNHVDLTLCLLCFIM